MAQVLQETKVGGVAEDDSEDSSSDSDAEPEDKEVPISPLLPSQQGPKSITVSDKSEPIGAGSPPSNSVPRETEKESTTAPTELENDPLSSAIPQAGRDNGVISKGLAEGRANSPSGQEPEKDLTSQKELPGANNDLNDEPLGASSQSLTKVLVVDSSSDSEADTKKSGSVTGKDGVFKPFSKKTLRSKASIKIRIRQKEKENEVSSTAAESEEVIDVTVDKDSKENTTTDGSTKVKSKSTVTHKNKRENVSKRHKRPSRKSRSRSRIRYRSRTRSRPRTRSRTKSRSKTRSKGRYRRRRSRSYSRSPRRHRRSRSRSYSHSRRSRRRRSHSCSRYQSKSRSRSRSRYRTRSRSRSHSYSSSPPPTKQRKNSTDIEQKGKKVEPNKQEANEKDSQVQAVVVDGTTSKKKEISQLTALCKGLQEKQAHEDIYGESPEVEITAVRVL